MLSANIVAILSAGLAPAVFALPVAENQSPAFGDFMALYSGDNPPVLANPIDPTATEGLEKRQVDSQGLAALTKLDMPGYCGTTSEPDNAGRPQYFIDLSQNVQDAGIGENACVTFIAGSERSCDTVGPKERLDLKKAVQKMRQKNGLFSQTWVGAWSLSFELFGNHKAPFDAVMHWNAAIDELPWDNQPATKELTAIMLSFEGTRIRADKQCKGESRWG